MELPPEAKARIAAQREADAEYQRRADEARAAELAKGNRRSRRRQAAQARRR